MRCAVYTRVSTDEQAKEGLSLAMQEEACRKAALAAGATAVETFCDDGYTGTNEDRPKFAELMARLPEFDSLFVWKLDRLSRSPFAWEKILVRFEEATTGFTSVTESLDLSTPLGRAMLRIMAVFAGLFVDNLRENVRAALNHRATVKGLPHSRPAYGYTYPGDDQPWETEPTEAYYVQESFRRYAAGAQVIQVARWLNEVQAPLKHGGKQWWARTVWQLLTNPVYVGEYRYNGETYPGEHKPLIDRALFDRVQERLRVGATIRPSARKKSLASLFKCGLCGGFMLRNGTGKRPDAQGRYVCHAAENLRREDRHESVTVTAPKAEAAVWAYVEWLFREDVLQQAAEKHVKRLAARRTSGASTKTRKRLGEIDRVIAKNLRAFQVGAIDEELLARENKGLLEEKARLKQSLEEAETPPAFRGALERLSGLSPAETIADLRTAPADRQLAVLRLLFEKVEVFPGSLVFHHQGGLLPPATIPLPKLYAPKRGLGEIVIPSDPYFATCTLADRR